MRPAGNPVTIATSAGPWDSPAVTSSRVTRPSVIRGATVAGRRPEASSVICLLVGGCALSYRQWSGETPLGDCDEAMRPALASLAAWDYQEGSENEGASSAPRADTRGGVLVRGRR